MDEEKRQNLLRTEEAIISGSAAVEENASFFPLCRGYLLGCWRYRHQQASELMPEDLRMTNATKRLFRKLSRTEKEVLNYYCRFAPKPDGLTMKQCGIILSGLCLRLAFESGLVNRFAWIPYSEGRTQNES